MKSIQFRKALRISTFLAVSTGLAIGTSAAVASPPGSQAPIEIAGEGYDGDQPAEHEEEVLGEQEELAEEAVDYPRDIENFAEFIEDHRQEGIDDVADYVQEGTSHMADAIDEVIPSEGGLFAEEPAEFETLQERHSAWEDRLDELAERERLDYSELVEDLLNEGAQLLTAVQETSYPGVAEQVRQVSAAVGQIDAEMGIDAQGESIQSYFEASLVAIEAMYVASEEAEPVTLRVSAPMAQAEGGLFDWGDDEMPGSVEDFYNFVVEHQEEGVPHVADYTREASQHYHDSLADFISDDQELLQEQLNAFSETVDALDDTPRAQYPQSLVNALNEGTQVLTIIQQAHYSGHEQGVRDLNHAIDQINTAMAIEAQVEMIQNAFYQAASTLRSMALDTAPPAAAQGSSGVMLAADNPVGDEPGMGEPGIEDDPTMEAPEVELSQEVQEYSDFVEGLDEAQLTGDEGQQLAANGLRHLARGVSLFIDEGEALEEPIEPTQYDGGMEEAPGLEMEEEQAQDLSDMHDEFSNAIDDLEASVGTDEYMQNLKETVDMAAEVLTNIQTENFPGWDSWSQSVQDAANGIDGETEFNEQSSPIYSFFTATTDVLEQMDREQVEEPMVRLF